MRQEAPLHPPSSPSMSPPTRRTLRLAVGSGGSTSLSRQLTACAQQQEAVQYVSTCAECQCGCRMSARVRNVNAGAECQCRCGVSIRVQMMPHTLSAGCRLREPRSHGQQTAVRGGGPPRPLTEVTGGVLSFSCLFSSPASLSTCTGGPRGGSSGGAQGGRLSERNLRQEHRLHTLDTLLSNVDACGCIWDARQGCCTLCSLGSNAKEAQGERVLMGAEGS